MSDIAERIKKLALKKDTGEALAEAKRGLTIKPYVTQGGLGYLRKVVVRAMREKAANNEIILATRIFELHEELAAKNPEALKGLDIPNLIQDAVKTARVMEKDGTYKTELAKKDGEFYFLMKLICLKAEEESKRLEAAAKEKTQDITLSK